MGDFQWEIKKDILPINERVEYAPLANSILKLNIKSNMLHGNTHNSNDKIQTKDLTVP